LAETGPVPAAIATEAAKTLGISRSMLYRLVARFRAQPQLSTLLPGTPGRRYETHRLSKALERVIARTIEDVYLQRERPRVADLIRMVNARCHEAGLAPPHYRTVKRRLAEINEQEMTRRRHSARAARERFGPVQTSSLNPTDPLQVVQIDHTEVDVIVVDERERLPLGRPWLTLALDVATRVVIGFSVSLDAPSTVSVAQVLTHAVLPKDVWLADRELEVPWPMFGMPRLLHLDNSSEFHSETLGRAAQQHGIRLEFRPMAQPHFGGHIERLIGRMMGAVHLLPGSTFADTVDKGDYDSEKCAVLTLAELERWLALEIAGVYHHSIHAALGTSPFAAWHEGLAKQPQTPREPVDRQTFFLDFLPGEHRLVRRDGIQLFWLHYWDNVLSPWAGRSTKRMLVKYNPRNLSRIYVRDEHGTYWPIPYRDLGQPAISLWEQRAAVKRLREEGHRVLDDPLICESVLRQRAVVDTARSTTQQRRAQARRPDAATEALATVSGTHATAEVDYSDLPRYPVEEWPS
jgi:putative transposase